MMVIDQRLIVSMMVIDQRSAAFADGSFARWVVSMTSSIQSSCSVS
jgi:hypothetical protein